MSLTASLTIDLGAIAANWRALDAMTPPETETAAVLKANAYGCGAAEVGPALVRAGARTFFVALPGEASVLRAAVGPKPTIYVLGGYMPGDKAVYRTHDIRGVLNSRMQAEAWFTDFPGEPAAVQLDTGMNRLGMEEAEIPPLPKDGSVALVMSHLACADDPRSDLNRAQLLEFNRLAGMLDLAAPLSLAATGGILIHPEFHFDLARPGVGLFGGLPFGDARPVVRLTVPVIQIREVQAGETVGYGASWAATKPTRVAAIAAGYADGLIRAMGNRARVFWNGEPLPVIGRVSMDMATIDVSSTPDIAAGDHVELIGPNQTVDQLAHAAGTIGYEILTSLGDRYTRTYCG